MMILSHNITCPEYDPIFFAVIRFVSITGLLFNLSGLYIIHYHSPKSMTGYKRYLAFYQMVSGFCDITIGELVTPLLTFPLVAGVPVGLLRSLGVDTRFQMILGFLAAFITFAAMGTLFLYRSNTVLPRGHWIVQTEKEIFRNTLFSVCFIITVIFGIQTSCFYFSRNSDFRAESIRGYPSMACIINDPFFFTYSEPYEKVILVFVGVSLIGFMILVGVSIGSTYYSIAFGNPALSAKTRKLQWKAMVVLIGQVFIPLVIGVGPLAIGVLVCTSNNVDTAALSTWLILLTSNHGVLSTIFIIALHPPYRKYVFSKAFGKVQGFFGVAVTAKPETRPSNLKFTSTSVAGVSQIQVY